MRRSIAILALFFSLLAVPRLAAAQDNPFSSCRIEDAVFSLGTRTDPIPERPSAHRIRLNGAVRIPCNDMVLIADEVIYDDDTKEVHAIGNVSLQQPDLSIFAEQAVLNGQTKLGTFYNAHGLAVVAEQPAVRSQFGTMEPDVMFYGAEVSKTGPKTYTIRDGGFSTCTQATPRWQLSTSSGTITMDEHAVLKNVVLHVKDVPLLYLPIMYYPIDKDDRATGFLLPTYGSSSLQGSSISNAFFLVLGRSQDATFYHNWFSQTGQGLGSEYRYVASPGSRGNMEFYMLDEHEQLREDGMVDRPAHRSYRLDGDANQALPHGFRTYGRVNYFTDVSAQQISQDIVSYSQRQRSFSGTVTGSLGRYRLTAVADRRDLFYGVERATRSGTLPVVSLDVGDTPIGRSRIYVGGSVEGGYIVRQDDIDDPTTDRSLWRFDGGPTIRAPLSTLSFLSATGSASLRMTRWLESIDPISNQQVAVPLTRQILDMQARAVGPVFSRVFLTPNGKYATGFKHLIEPTFAIRRTTAFSDFDRVVQNDSVDAIVGGTTSIDYGITNRLLAKRPGPPRPPGTPPAPGVVREILSVELSQSYYTDSRAAAYDRRYLSNGELSNLENQGGTFGPLHLRAISRPTDRATAEFSMEIDSKYRAIRTMRASGGLQGERVQLRLGWSKVQQIEGLPGYEGPGDHFLTGSTTIRTAGNRYGGTYSFDLDVAEASFVQQRVLAYYNSQCCGISFDFQRITVPLYRSIPSDTRFGVSFTLAGIGSFSNPLGSFGGR